MNTYSIFLLFSLFLMPGIVLYSYADWEDEERADECRKFVDKLSKYDVMPRSLLCSYENFCKDVHITVSGSRDALEEDYITQKFLDTNPPLSLENPRISQTGHFFYIFTWYLYNTQDSYPQLFVSFDKCGNITEYQYEYAEDEWFTASYPRDETRENLGKFEDQRYEIIKAVLDRHPPPDVQVAEFGRNPGEITCNGDGFEPYVRNGHDFACMSPQAFVLMMERGMDIRPV